MLIVRENVKIDVLHLLSGYSTVIKKEIQSKSPVHSFSL